MNHEQKVEALWAHTGLQAKAEAEMIASRVAACADARAKKRAAYQKFDAERSRLVKQLDAAERQQIEAQKQAALRYEEASKVREQFSTVHEVISRINAEQDATLRANADPRIAEFVAELRGLKDDAAGWRVDNMELINRRIRLLNSTIEAASRLVTDFDVTDIGAAIDQLRQLISRVGA